MSTAIAFDILARDKASQTLERVGHKAEEQHGRLAGLGQMFSRFGSMVGGEVGELADKVSEGFDRMGEHEGKLGSKLMAAGGIVTGLGAFLQTMGSKDKAAMQQLDAAVDATGKGFEGFHEQVEKAIKRSENFGHAAPDTIEALRRLTQATDDPKVALQDLGVAEDLAAAKHENLTEAAGQLAKVHGGAGRILKEFGISLKNSHAAIAALTAAERQHQNAVDTLAKAKQHLSDLEAIDATKKHLGVAAAIALRNAHEAVAKASLSLADKTTNLSIAQRDAKDATNASGDAIAQLGEKLHGQAAANVNTFTGHLEVLKTKLLDNASAFGEHFGGAITAAGPVLFGFGAIMETGMIGKLATAGKAIGSFGVTMVTTMAKAGLAMVEMAGKALIWGAEMLAAGIEAALPFLPLIAAVALVGFAAYELYKHWDQVWGGIKDVLHGTWDVIRPVFHAIGSAFSGIWDGLKTAFRWVTDNWPYLLGALTGPFGLAAAWIFKHWDQVVGFVTGLGARIGSAASGMWDGIKDAFRSAINWIIDGWDGLHFKMPSIDTHIPGVGKVGGFDLGLPQIPHLAKGGIVDHPTLALIGEAGPEEVKPLPRGGAGGGITINLTVQGSVIQERDLARTVRDGIAQDMRRRGVDPAVLGLAG